MADRRLLLRSREAGRIVADAELGQRAIGIDASLGHLDPYKAAPNDVETQRRRRSSANRVLTILKAALNHAYDEGKVASNDAWGRRVKPYRAVDVARLRFLTVAEARRLINASGARLP